ncbi:hypothetical protein KPH14_012008 [Odynerus spinipes]|uniref:DDE Tnp4 domain-containing protein n=1 Tax=Odynerus spinipes TaxID=1348599 RepID=A0AAD9RF72_9HYME|nr:hypothetical protein KPH14_012008 [Odynerus spinipes]
MPPFSGSEYYNYKKLFSIILLAVVDADYCFTFVDVGHSGRNSDCNIFTNSVLSSKLKENSLKVPQNRKLPFDELGEPMPFGFIGDEAFAVSSHIMRPYPNQYLGEKKGYSTIV